MASMHEDLDPNDDENTPRINAKEPEKMTVDEMKAWLRHKGAPTKGKKSELLARVNACLRYGWDKNEDIDDVLTSCAVRMKEVDIKYPEDGWLPLVSDAVTQMDSLRDFNMSHIVSYFVSRRVQDCLPAGDFKSVNKSSENLFRCGHVQSIQFTVVNSVLYIKSKCLPEMRKDRVYCVLMALQSNTSDIISAECGCPAGCGPTGSCKHIGALSYALAEYIRFQVIDSWTKKIEKGFQGYKRWEANIKSNLSFIALYSIETKL